jgi:hypothetical protein
LDKPNEKTNRKAIDGKNTAQTDQYHNLIFTILNCPDQYLGKYIKIKDPLSSLFPARNRSIASTKAQASKKAGVNEIFCLGSALLARSMAFKVA